MGVLIQINNIHKSYGPNVIFDEASVILSSEQKIGLIGRNGAGKSTLCKLITGHEELDSGEIRKSSDLRLSYLEQQDPFKQEETVIDFLMRYTGREEWECGEMAWRFQLHHDLLEKPIKSLSGGFQTRVKLVSMMLRQPNFLILDEPTNYLDLSTLILLENFLQDYNGGFIIVSHDREFLKRTCEETLEVENGQLTIYPGKIEDYFAFKTEQKEQALAYNKNVEAKRKQLQRFVDRFGAKASKASQARSKKKQIERLKPIEIDNPLATVKVKIPLVEKRNGLALRCEDLAIGYPEKVVAKNIRVEALCGARVAILGDNGQGKTTFLRTIAGDLQAKHGAHRWGNNLKIAYYAQHVYQAIDPTLDVYSYLDSRTADGITSQEILNIAGSFLFKGEDVRKKVSVLSGGERARLCLAGMLLTKSNVLLLDEPTNHLDFETVEALGNALKDFLGTIFFISHDRTFVNLVATEIFDVKEGRVINYPGDYAEYVYYLERKVAEEMGETVVENVVEEINPEPQKVSPKKSQRAEKFQFEMD
ncbi:MAG: ABC-F family ATP-binding cassette domain-containing protein [Candidatus Omnitrophica bacterium]|nr:ABC-F family ATP-binding cassette domain-containing protein [Candidatus Omnitrophota bacterium]